MSGTVIAMPDRPRRCLIALGDHEPVLVEDELQLLRVGVEVLLGVRHEVPVLRPRGVVDLGEGVHVFAQLPAAHRAHADAVLGLAPSRRARQITGSTLSRSVTSRFHISRSIALVIPACSHSAAGSRAGATAGGSSARSSKPSIRMPLSSFIVKSAGPDHPLPAALAQPGLRRRRAAPSSASWSSSNSRNPNQPQRLPLVAR